MKITRNEYKALKYISEDVVIEKGIIVAPRGLTQAQFKVVARSLGEKQMIRPAFVEGGDMEAVGLLDSGQAMLDNINDMYRHVLRKTVKFYDIDMDKYTTLLNARTVGKVRNNLYNDWQDFKEAVLNPLLLDKLVELRREESRFAITRLGIQMLDNIEDDVVEKLPLVGDVILEKDDYSDDIDDFDDETVIIEAGIGKKIKRHKVTAKLVTDCVKESGLINETTKTKWEELLSKITGLSQATLHKHICGLN